MILRLLYKWFPQGFAKLVFMDQRKPVNFEKLTRKFIDSNGIPYYTWPNEMDIPLTRKGHFEKCLKEVEYGLDHKELSGIIEAMEQALTRKDGKGNMMPDIAMIGWLIAEVKNRKQNLIHPEILMDMVSCIYIREDENPYKFDQEIHNQKVAQFNKDSETGLHDFFYTAGLGEYIPFLKRSGVDWDLIFTQQKVRIAALKEALKNYSTERKLRSS